MFWFRIGLSCTVVVVWVGDWINSLANPTASTHDGFTGLMVLVLSWAIGGGVRDNIKRRLNGGDDD